MDTKNPKEQYELPSGHPFSSKWSIMQWAMDLSESALTERHRILRLYDGFQAALPKWQKEFEAFTEFRSYMSKIIWGLASIPSGAYTEGPLAYKDRNYSSPEQPERDFNDQNITYLVQHLDNNIRILEGKRDLPERNYLDSHDSVDLNRTKLMRKIVEEWRLYRELSERS